MQCSPYVHQGIAVQEDCLGAPPENLTVAQGAGTAIHLPSTFPLLWISLLPSIPTTIPSQGASSPSPPAHPSQPLLALFALQASLGGTTFPCLHFSMINSILGNNDHVGLRNLAFSCMESLVLLVPSSGYKDLRRELHLQTLFLCLEHINGFWTRSKLSIQEKQGITSSESVLYMSLSQGVAQVTFRFQFYGIFSRNQPKNLESAIT